jgi:hypothetical protein
LQDNPLHSFNRSAREPHKIRAPDRVKTIRRQTAKSSLKIDLREFMNGLIIEPLPASASLPSG